MINTKKLTKLLVIVFAYILAVTILVSGSFVLKSQIESIYFNTSGATQMIITEEGKVGIGTLTPTTTFEVNGSARIYGSPWSSPKHDSWKQNNTFTIHGGGISISEDFGTHSYITIGGDGLPALVYFNYSGLDVIFVHCENLNCSKSTSKEIVSGTGFYPHIIVGFDGNPIIISSGYVSGVDNPLLNYCNDKNCDNSINISVDVGVDVLSKHPMKIGSDGNPIFLFTDSFLDNLGIIHCGNYYCNESNTINTSLVYLNPSTGGNYYDIAIGGDGLPLIMYYDISSTALSMIHCGTVFCNESLKFRTLDNSADVGKYLSLSIGSDGLPIVSYLDVTNTALKFLKCEDVTCSTTQINTVDNTDVSGYSNSLTVNPSGFPVIIHYEWDESNGKLKIVNCQNLNCSKNVFRTLEQGGDTGLLSSIAYGVDGLPIMGYYDYTNSEFKTLHCGSPNCVPYWGRR